MPEKIAQLKIFLLKNKITVGLIAALLLIVVGGFFAFKSFSAKTQAEQTPVAEIDLAFDAEGPYALLFPRRDGNALILNLKRTASYDEISYELAYTSLPDESVSESVTKSTGEDGDSDSAISAPSIDRGVVGTINTDDKKGEYEQEILFGSCSKSVCKYDKGVENGTLILRIRKGNLAYRMITQWHLQKPDQALGLLTSGDEHFSYRIDAKTEELDLVGYSIINDLSGVPKLPTGKQITGKVYAINIPLAKFLPKGTVNFEVAENPPEGSKLARFDEGQNKWIEYDAAINSGKVTTEVEGSGIFAILAPIN